MPSDESAQREKLQSILQAAHLDGVKLDYTGRRGNYDAWTGSLWTRVGDATLKMWFYDFESDPGLIVDFGEDRAAVSDSTSPLRLLFEHMRDQHGVLVLASPTDEPLVRRYMNLTPAPLAGSGLAYHPQLDRILDGDYTHQMNGRWLKACLFACDDMVPLFELLKELQANCDRVAANDSRDDPSVPIPVVAFELKTVSILRDGRTIEVSIEELLQFEEFASAPPKYHRIGLAQFAISNPRPFIASAAGEKVDPAAFTRRVCHTIRCGHSLNCAFTRNRGGAIVPEFIASNGALIDPYFIHRLVAQSATAEQQRILEVDLFNALIVLSEMSRRNNASLASVLEVGMCTYLNQSSLSQEFLKLISQNAANLERLPPNQAACSQSARVLVDLLVHEAASRTP